MITTGYLQVVEQKADDPLLAVIDRQLEIERKARAWDELMRLYERHDTGLIHIDVAIGLVHPAQTPSKG